jgi:hypothetical protein
MRENHCCWLFHGLRLLVVNDANREPSAERSVGFGFRDLFWGSRIENRIGEGAGHGLREYPSPALPALQDGECL